MCKKSADGYISLGHIVLFGEVFARVIGDGSFLNLNRTNLVPRALFPSALGTRLEQNWRQNVKGSPVQVGLSKRHGKKWNPLSPYCGREETKNINVNCYRPLPKYFLIRQFRKRAWKSSGCRTLRKPFQRNKPIDATWKKKKKSLQPRISYTETLRKLVSQ